MRSDAEIDEIALAIETDRLAPGDLGDPLRLVALADALEEGDRRVALPDLAGDRLVAPDDVAHPRLDLLEVLGRERRGASEIVIESVFGGRAEGDLGFGIELLDRLGHHMRRVVAQDVEPVRLVAGDDRDRGVMVDDRREVARLAVELQRDRRLGEARADRGGDVGAGSAARRNCDVLPSGSVTTTGFPDAVSFMAPSAPSFGGAGNGPMATKKPRPLAGGVVRVQALAAGSAYAISSSAPRRAEWWSSLSW